MKKSLLALAVLGAYAGVASAQSSVTLYGTLDVNGRYVKADGQKRRLSEATDGINSSQLGFRGVEDLGGGLRAGFTLLAGHNPDSGTANAKFWNRRSTVSLFGGFGEVRLGRDYTPTFWNLTIFDAFGTNGLGASTIPRQLYGGTRQDNTIGYFLPANLGGFYGQAMVGASEGGASGDAPARYVGARFGFAAGPFDVAVAGASQKYATAFARNTVAGGGLAGGIVTALPGDTQKTFNIGGSWDFGFFKLLGYYDQEKLRGAKEKMGSISGVIPFGQSEVHVGYDRSKYTNTGVSTTLDMIKATYQYNLSKRTAMYTTASRLDNKDGTRYTLPGASGLTSASGNSTGIEFGIRHFF
jgi:predicted porin